MKSKRIKLSALVIGMTLFAAPAFAADYSGYSTDELAEMRGTMRDVPTEDRDQFRNEWQKRINEMPVEDRSRYNSRPENAVRDGEGMGRDGKKNMNQNQNQNRNQNRISDGEGSGYGGGNGGGMGRGVGGGGGRR
ncbi:MAG: hypothetical protein H8E41_07835 [Desulfobulbaceae bacterium]|uniref:DUF1104 domain-containing protein n=1 Tax=Candidatus Desulfobia pelagia TaxID=2841692 RepID=A0A8J6NFA9_9BACT|nr:hypothetical protein [Candidatus Desulfobia pelagia]